MQILTKPPYWVLSVYVYKPFDSVFIQCSITAKTVCRYVPLIKNSQF